MVTVKVIKDLLAYRRVYPRERDVRGYTLADFMRPAVSASGGVQPKAKRGEKQPFEPPARQD